MNVAERLGRSRIAILLADFIFDHRLDAVVPSRWNVGAMTNIVMNSARLTRIRLLGVVCRPRPARRNEKAIDESRERRHHHQQPGRDRQDGHHHEKLNDPAGRRGVACGEERIEIDRLGQRAGRRQNQNRERRKYPFAHHSSMQAADQAGRESRRGRGFSPGRQAARANSEIL